MLIHKAFQFRIYPNHKQQVLIVSAVLLAVVFEINTVQVSRSSSSSKLITDISSMHNSM